MKVCNFCSFLTEYSEETGKSTLKIHLKAKHKAQHDKLFGEGELSSDNIDNMEKTDYEHEDGGKKKKILVPLTFQKNLRDAFKQSDENSALRNFAILKAVHDLPYRIFDSYYFRKALESYILQGREKVKWENDKRRNR